MLVISDPKILALAFIGGIIPSLFWLWFWLNEDKKNPEPKMLLAIVFFIGMIGVFFVLQINQFIHLHISDNNLKIVLWASVEEVIKFLAVIVVLLKTNYIDEPIDWPIYLITAALGFAALENALFLIKPLSIGATTVSLLTGQLRFLGSTLLHTVSSGVLGIALGLAFHLKGFRKELNIIIGFAFAIALHSVFNFFIIRIDSSKANHFLELLKVFGFLWVVTIIVMLLFEKVRRMN